ncbi:MAG: hypothetical protein WBF77_06475 [Sulfurimonadaceae bacterium]
MKKYIVFMIVGFILQGCVAKNQDMYAEDALSDRHERGESVSKAVNTYIAPVVAIPGALVVGTIQGVGEVATYAANNPELMEQGIKTYQQVEYEQRVDRERAYRASSDLREMTNGNSTSSQNSKVQTTTDYDTTPLHYTYTEATYEPEKKQLRECVFYYADHTWREREGVVFSEHSTSTFFQNRSAGDSIYCRGSNYTNSECHIYKIDKKAYTHVVNDETIHYAINYVITKQVSQLEPSETCYENCAKGVCATPSGVDRYIASQNYDKTFNHGPSLAQ